jgi:hypothetical protein
LLPLSTDQLADQLKDLQSKSPQSPDLPIQEGLFAKNILANILRNMDLELLEAPSGTFFVLGDTPTPQSELSLGFNLPLSKSFALRFSSIRGNQSPATGSRVVTSDEVDKINQDQYNAAASIVIGPNPSAFAKIAP